MQYVLFFIVAAGLTNILVHGAIFNKIRPKQKLFNCSMCMGFWVALFIGIFDICDVVTLFNFVNNLMDLFLVSCGSSLISYILCESFGDEGLRIKENEKQRKKK